METVAEKYIATKQLPIAFDSASQSLFKLLSALEVEQYAQFSFCGGWTRDMVINLFHYKDITYSDIDIACTNENSFRNPLEQSGMVIHGTETNGDHQMHDYFMDPYDFSKKRIPIHFFHTPDMAGLAPGTFDFSINEVSLKSNGLFYAPTQTWKDLQKGIVRLNKGRNLTTNLMMRAIRFSIRLGFVIEPNTLKQIRAKIIEGNLDDERIYFVGNKMQQDGIGAECHALMRRLKFPSALEHNSMEELLKYHNNRIVTGQAYTEPRHEMNFDY